MIRNASMASDKSYHIILCSMCYGMSHYDIPCGTISYDIALHDLILRWLVVHPTVVYYIIY